MTTDTEAKSSETKGVAILIDGNNFYNGLLASKLKNFDLNEFNYEEFNNLIAETRSIQIKRFYQGLVKKEQGNEKSERMVSSQQRLLARLENTGWEVKRGNMQKNKKSGTCAGFYFLNREVNNKYDFKNEKTAESILDKFKLHYEPIIVIPKNSQIREDLEKILITNGEELVRFGNLYYVLNYWEEKGVDVNIAIDLLELAYSCKLDSSCKIDTIILVSSDSDLKPAVDKASLLGINIEYVGFDQMFSVALLNNSNIKKRTLLTKNQLEKFVNKTLI